MNLKRKIANLHADRKKGFAVLIDPDYAEEAHLDALISLSELSPIDFFFVGGSLLTVANLQNTVSYLKEKSDIPVVLFPGPNMQLDVNADGILFLSLISGRNADLLIGQHVASAPIIRQSNLEVLPTGYLLIGNSQSTAVYMSQTQPIPSKKYAVATSTAIAGELLGLQYMYLDAGSGASEPIQPKLITSVKKAVNTPIIVGGGINSVARADDAFRAGADILVVGNAIEENTALLTDIAELTKVYNDTKSTVNHTK